MKSTSKRASAGGRDATLNSLVYPPHRRRICTRRQQQRRSPTPGILSTLALGKERHRQPRRSRRDRRRRPRTRHHESQRRPTCRGRDHQPHLPIRLPDSAITENTALLLKVHTSNFKVIGFTEAPDTRDLCCNLARETSIPLVHDVGSGCLVDTRQFGLSEEPTPQDSISAGADLVAFSGDKLLGGPQAGIIAGRKDLVSQLAKHPLARAARIDKMTMAALTSTLLHYLKEEHLDKVPVWRMISASVDDIKSRAQAWQGQIGRGFLRCHNSIDHRRR